MERHEHITMQTAGIPGIPVLRARIAGLRLEQAARRLSRLLKANFDPNQPRVPAGNPRGGQWTSTGGGSGGNGSGSRRRLARNESDSEVLSDASPDDFTKPGTRVAQAGRGRAGPRQIWINGQWLTPTPAQQALLTILQPRAEAAIGRVRDIDPSWNPPRSTESSISGRIRRLRGEAEAAEARLRELANQSPLELVNTYRALNNSRDLFGVETWPRDQDTVAITFVNRVPFAGANSTAPTFTRSDRMAADRLRDKTVPTLPKDMKRTNIGWTPYNAFYHAESTILLRVARAHGGSLAGRKLEVYVDRPMCSSCRELLPHIGLQLGNPRVTFVDPMGVRRTMQDGRWER